MRGDSTRLQQIFWNLINNAQKFTGADGHDHRPLVRRRRTAAIRVEVSDTGAGIDPAVLPKLFNAFEQGEVRAARQQAGLGLGLAISKKLAEAHGGTITATQRGPRAGGDVHASSCRSSRRSRPSPAAHRPAPATAGPAVRPLDVLLVEDHEPTLPVLTTKLLRHLGHRVTGVTSVASATAAARQERFDLIISDLGLPDGSGLDVMRQLATATPAARSRSPATAWRPTSPPAATRGSPST